MKNKHTVLIVGGGPTGLMLGVILAAAGVPFRLIDKARAAGKGSRAYLLHSRTLELLAHLGLADVFLREGHRVNRIVLRRGGEVLERVRMERLESPFPFSLAVPQGMVERVLENALERLGGKVERGAELMDVRLPMGGRELGAWAKVRDAEQVIQAEEYLCVAGCDGAASTVRHCFEPGFVEDWGREGYAIGDVELEGKGPEGEAWLFEDEEGFAFLCPLGGGVWRVTARLDERALQMGLDGEELAVLVRRRSGGLVHVRGVRDAGVHQVHRRCAARFQMGGAFLLGAAACVHHPLTCQGLNAGLQDAINLGWKIAMAAEGAAAPELLVSYEAERLPVALEVALADERLLRLGLREGRAAPHEAILGMVSGLPPIAVALARDLAGLSVHYRGGPLTEEARRGFATRAQMRSGERVPDFAVSLPDGTGRKISELLRGARPGEAGFHLFVAPHHSGEFGAGSFGDARRLVEGVKEDFGERVKTHWLLTPAQSMALRDALPEHLVDLAGEGVHYLGLAPFGVALVRPDFYACYAARDFDLGRLRLAALSFLA